MMRKRRELQMNYVQPDEDVSFYRQLDPLNVNEYPKFPGQTRNPLDAIFEDDTHHYGNEDGQTELHAPEILLPLINLPVLKNMSKNLKIDLNFWRQ